jgi:protein involved in polysaccharide export with SLBB domain
MSIFCLFVNFLLAQENSQPNPLETQSFVHLGDLVEVDVLGSTEYDWRGKLTPEGYLDGLDYVEEPIFALCRKEEDIAKEITDSYKKFLRNPIVTVKILDASERPISTIYGAVNRPQRIKIKRPIRLNELLVLSGGFTERVSNELQIYRPQGADCQTILEKPSQDIIKISIKDLLSGKAEANPYIRMGDIINVFEADSIYLIGGVANPKQIFFREEMTLSRAINSVGGLAQNANAKNISIFRRVNGETQIIEADLDKIKEKINDDIKLQAFDIIDVGETGKPPKKVKPVLNFNEKREQNIANLPLRIIE